VRREWECEVGLGGKEDTSYPKVEAMEVVRLVSVWRGTNVVSWKLVDRPVARAKSSRIYLSWIAAGREAQAWIRVSSAY
jgi:hypothetical protein